ncbi:MAG: DUF937 domain-containing protein [Mesorhizobium sp.]|nr:MAG: DUF937 domain-containing protein [Mesorhizobium sp.]
MPSLFDIFAQAQNGAGMQALAQQFGLSMQQTQAAVQALLPAFSQGLQRNTADPYGMGAFMTAMASGQHAKYFEDATRAFSPQGIDEGNGILGHLFGSKDLSRAVADVSPGNKETLDVWRNGKAMQISADVGRNTDDQKTASNDEGGKPSAGDGLRVPSLGLGLTDLTPDIREQLNLADNQRGAVVERVNPDKAASAAGIEPGDVIVAVDRTPVKSARQANQAIAEAGKSGRKSVLLLVDRGDAQIFVAVPFAAG